MNDVFHVFENEFYMSILKRMMEYTCFQMFYMMFLSQ